MVFSLGNVITLFIVVLVLAIYRQMDRNNRSLDKIRRYSDKIKDELDGFVDGKTQEVKNLAIDLDVHQKTGKEILKRIVAIEDELGKKADHIEAVHQRMADYNKALDELNQMAGRVDENLKRLQEESDFVDKVGKRVKEAGVKMLQLEKQIPALNEAFSKENSSSLQKVAGEVLKQSRRIASAVEEKVNLADSRVEGFRESLDQMEAQRASMEEETLRTIREQLDEAVYRTEQRGDEMKESFTRELESLLENSRGEGESLQSRLEAGLARMANSLDDVNSRMDDSLENFRERVAGVERLYHASLEKAADRGRSLEDEALEALKKHFEARRGETEKELSVRLEETRQETEGFRERITGDYRSFESTLEASLGENRQQLQEQQDLLQQLVQRTGELETDLKQRQEAKLQSFEEKIEKTFTELEDKISGWEEEVSYRFTRIEEVSADIDSLESNLRDSMERVSGRVREDFGRFKDEMATWRREEKERADGDIAVIRGEIRSTEEQLNLLKEQAYENVSEKLQVFESDFFSDLQRRAGQMDERFDTWKGDVDLKLEELASEGENSRKKVENDYSEQLKERLGELQSRIYGQQEKFEQQVAAFQDRISGRMDTTTRALDGLEESLKAHIEDAKESSRTAFQKEFTDHETTVTTQLKRQERELFTALTELSERVESRRQELSHMMELAGSDLRQWQERMFQEMEEHSSELSGRQDELRRTSEEVVHTVRQEFESQRDDLIIQTQEERNRLKNELKEISDTILEFETDLRKRTESALDNFSRDYETFMLEVQKRNRDFQTDLDKRIKDFKTFGGETREKVEQLQKKLLGKVEENAASLEVQLNEVDKRLKHFTSQTRLFERADNLKISLQETIEDLKAEVSRVEAQSQEIRETERKFQSIKKLGDEVQGRLNRFLNEKRRLEEMEGDFKKLINISQAVDVKLDQVTGSHDELQGILARLRQLEELENEIEQRYERLEKRRDVMDSTIDGVDSNFQRMSDLEEQLKGLDKRLTDIPASIDEMARRIETLASNKKKAEETISRLEQLDEILADSEKRIDELQKAREWLARTETRLEEVGQQAREQVKLLGSIMKDDGKGSGESAGAPGMNARELVSRLARQGWTVDQISRATKLSRGEVELILEMIPNKG